MRKRARFVPKKRNGKIVAFQHRGDEVSVEDINDKVHSPLVVEDG